MKRRERIELFEKLDNYYNADTSETNKQGEAGETVAKEVLQQRGIYVIDVAKNLDAEVDCIDLVVNKDDKTFSIDVKWCGRIAETGNIYAEIGNLNITKSEYQMYGDRVNEVFYFYRTSHIKNFLHENWNSVKYTYNPNFGKLVPVKWFIDWCSDNNKIVYTIDVNTYEWKKNIKG